jgi:hypothetical protein
VQANFHGKCHHCSAAHQIPDRKIYIIPLSTGKFHDEDSIISSTDKFHGKIASFPQGVKTSTKIKKNIISFHPSK